MVRSQAVWNEIKTTLMERAGAVTFELTRAVARRILLARVGLPAPRETE
jgi:hypothetical protein